MNVMKVKKSKVYVPRLLLLPLLAVLLLTSCARHSAAWPQLLEAEKLLDTDLLAAADLIDSVDASPLRGEDVALYAILKTQADWKRYITLSSDSLPRLATDFYGIPYRKNYRAAMAWYSLGCFFTEHDADADAVEAYLKAMDLFPDTLSRYHALCYQNIGKHLYFHGMPQDAIPYLRAFHEHPACKSDSALISNADYCLGVGYLRNHDFDNAEKAFYAVLGNRHASSADVQDVIFQLAKLLYVNHDNYGAALAFIDKYVTERHSLHQLGALWSLKGEIYYQYEQYDSAQYYYKRALSETHDLHTKCNAYKQMLNLAPLLKETDSIPFYTERYSSLLKQIYEQSRTDEMLSAKARYDISATSHQHKSQIITIVFSLIGVALLVLAVLAICRRRRKLIYGRSDSRNMIEASSISKQELINQCIYDFNQSSSASMIPPDRHFVERPPLEKREVLEQDLKEAFAKVEETLREEFPSMTPDDALLCAYMLLGLPSKEIVACSRFTTRSVASRKNRLRTKLSPEWLSFLFDAE